MSIVYRVLY